MKQFVFRFAVSRVKWWRRVFVCGSSSDVTLLAGIIVLEEFCKELAAIAFVKHYADTA